MRRIRLYAFTDTKVKQTDRQIKYFQGKECENKKTTSNLSHNGHSVSSRTQPLCFEKGDKMKFFFIISPGGELNGNFIWLTDKTPL